MRWAAGGRTLGPLGAWLLAGIVGLRAFGAGGALLLEGGVPLDDLVELHHQLVQLRPVVELHLAFDEAEKLADGAPQAARLGGGAALGLLHSHLVDARGRVLPEPQLRLLDLLHPVVRLDGGYRLHQLGLGIQKRQQRLHPVGLIAVGGLVHVPAHLAEGVHDQLAALCPAGVLALGAEQRVVAEVGQPPVALAVIRLYLAADVGNAELLERLSEPRQLLLNGLQVGQQRRRALRERRHRRRNLAGKGPLLVDVHLLVVASINHTEENLAVTNLKVAVSAQNCSTIC